MDKLTILIDLWLSVASHLDADRCAIIEDQAPGRRVCSYNNIELLVESTCDELYALGVRPNTPVFVAMKHSIEAVVLILSLWRIGAVYIPLECDQDNATNKIIKMLKDEMNTLLNY